MIHNSYTESADIDLQNTVPARKEKEKALLWRKTLSMHQRCLIKELDVCRSEKEYRTLAMEEDSLNHVMKMDDFYDYCVDYMCEHDIDTVVDIGCAYGHQSQAFTDEGVNYIGIESFDDGPKWNSDRCMYISKSYPCSIPDKCRFAVSNMCFEYFINDYEALARDFDTVILSGLGKNRAAAQKLFNIQKINYMPLYSSKSETLYVLMKKADTGE